MDKLIFGQDMEDVKKEQQTGRLGVSWLRTITMGDE